MKPGNDNILSLDDVKVHFKVGTGSETVKAVDGVTFALAQRDSIGIIGESGSGKSTLARVLVALLRPTAGTLLQDGVDPYALSSAERRKKHRQFQIIFQDPHAALNPRVKILNSVREPLEIAGLGGRKADRNDQAINMLERVGINSELAQRYPHELSGGAEAADQHRPRAHSGSEAARRGRGDGCARRLDSG